MKASNRAFIVAIAFLLSCGFASAAVLPVGGASVASAVPLAAGNYSGGPIAEDEVQYYSLTLHAGQELSVTGLFTPASAQYGTLNEVSIYASTGAQVRNEFDSGLNPITASWLPNSASDSYPVYFSVADTTWGTESFTLEVSVTNRFDADSSTDAGDTFDSAMPLSSGTYSGWLSGESGTDARDFYKIINYPALVPLYVNVTPPFGASMEIVFYDSNRQVIARETASNNGAIIINAVNSTSGGDIFVEIGCDGSCSKTPAGYRFSVLALSGASQPGPLGLPALPFGIPWTYACCCTVLLLLLIVIIVALFLRRKREFEAYGEYSAGSETASQGLLGYKHPCRYCGKLVGQGAKACPFCGKVSPLGPLRCPKCRNPIQNDFKVCSACGLQLDVECPKCGKRTFFGDYCENCDARLMVVCKSCLKEQPPIGEKCIKCNKKLVPIEGKAIGGKK